jgi:Nucleosome assembly protein (NAP)
VPEFWLTALRNHVALSALITDRDAAALKHLIDLRIEYLPSSEPKPGFKLIFEFSPNEYFENDVLQKTYVYREEVGYSGDFVYDRAIGTDIKWKDEKDLTKEFEIKKQRNKSASHIIWISDRSSDVGFTRYKSYAASTESTSNRVLLQLFHTSCCTERRGDRGWRDQ